jgi:integrase
MPYIRPTKWDANKQPLPGTRWAAQIYFGRDTTTGKTLWKSQTFATKKAAKDWAAKTETQRTDGAYRPTLGKVTFADYLRDTWLPLYRRQARSTYNIEKTLGKWILRPQPETPFLGRVPLAKLTPAHFDKLYVAMTQRRGDERADRPIRQRGVEYLHGLLKRALKSAVKKGELPRNPADGATIPKPDVDAEVTAEDFEQEGPARSLSHEQAARLLAAAKLDHRSALWHLLLDAGLRPGEAFALKWAQVTFDAKLVHVGATLTRAGVDKAKQGWKLTKPKTKRSERKVPVSDATIAELRRWKKQQVIERMKVGSEWQDHGFVFTTELGTPLSNKTTGWARLLRKADGGRGDLGTWGPEVKKEKKTGRPRGRSFTPKFPLYVLRHTSATLALLDGVDLLQVSRRLGHTDLSFTARMYGHMKAEHTTQAAESFNRLAAGVA